MNIYLDNNATTKMCNRALNSFEIASSLPINASSNYSMAKLASKKITYAKDNILSMHGCKGTHDLIFTSGASESNSMTINSIIHNFTDIIPHIIVSAVEHSGILLHVNDLYSRKLIDLTIVDVNIDSGINLEVLKNSILPNTVLVSIMAANNETGHINNLRSVLDIIRQYPNIIFHSDCTQSIGKYPVSHIPYNKLDIFSGSFHKIYGPIGIGFIIVRKGIQIKSLIYGHQNNELRGGTYQFALICAANAAITYANDLMRNKSTIISIKSVRDLLLYNISLYIPYILFSDYIKLSENDKYIYDPCIVVLSDVNAYNVILMSIVTKKVSFCNGKLREYADNNGIIIGIGSACLSGSAYASHVLDAIGCTDEIKRGTIRISLSINNINMDCKYVSKILLDGIFDQI
jgi:cysteine desulfurase